MVSLINLGNFTTIGGKTVSSGVASGLDVTTLVNDLVKLRQKPVEDLTASKDKNVNVISALGTLRSKFDVLQTALNALRNPPGILDRAQNIFNARQSFITSNTSVAGTTYLSATADTGADLSSYAITVDNVAKNKILRSGVAIFSSATDSVTDAAATNNANRFSAGTFQIAGGQVKNDISTPSADNLVSADYSVVGTVSGSLLDSTFGTGGIANITANGVTGDTGLIDDLSNAVITASQAGGVMGGDVTLELNLNGKTYFSNLLSANTGGGSNEIAAGTTVTFTNSASQTTFQIRLGTAAVIANATQLSTFASNVDSGLNGPKIYQSRTISAFDSSKVAGTSLAGLGVNNVQLVSNKFDAYNGTHGQISNFLVTHTGVDNNSIAVTINGETYQATGLLDTLNTNVTLVNTTDNNKTFKLNLADATVSLDLSSANNASAVQKDLNTIFGTGVNITLEQGDSLTTIADKINSTALTGNVSASVVKVTDSDYRLEIKSNLTGTDNAFTLNDTASDVFTSTVTLASAQAAENAAITVNGLQFIRSTNEIKDVINKVTLNLFLETPVATELKLDIDKNIPAVVTSISNFVNAYNDFLLFAAKMQERDPQTGAFKEEAYLGNNLTLNNALTSMQTKLTSMVSGLGVGDLKSLADLGMTLFDAPADETNEQPAVTNALAFDESKLTSLLSSDFDKVSKVFGAKFNSSENTKLFLLQSSNAVSINSVAVDKKFNVDIDVSRAVGSQARLTYNDGTTTVSIDADFDFNSEGGVITGVEGTVFEGLRLIYVGDGSDVITGNTLSQGIADQLYNIVSPMLEIDGALDTEVSSTQDDQGRIDSDIANKNLDIEAYRQELLTRFSAMEQAIARANNILQLLDAQASARNNS